MSRNILITGGSGILLFPLVEKCAQLGDNVIVVGLEETCEKVEILSENCKYVSCDVLNENSVKKLILDIENEYGYLDVLVNGAGGNNPKATTPLETHAESIGKNIDTFFDMTIDGFRKVNELNFLSTVIVTKYASKLLLKADNGCILNTSSMSSGKPMTKVPAYSAAKSAVDNFTKWMSVHFAESHIRVNSVAPGFFLTKQNEKLLLNDDGTLTERSGKIISHTPMRRFGTPDDLLEPMLFLINEEQSKFITGITLEVDGGFSAYAGV